MKKGDAIEIRPAGGKWLRGLVEVVSKNQKSLAVSVEEGLPCSDGFLFQRTTCRQVVMLLDEGDGYQDIRSRVLYETRAITVTEEATA